MNDNDLENQLRALTGSLQRPDPTPAWKAEILSRALREASVTPLKRNLPPRWLMVGWAASWTAIIAMNSFTPRDAAPHVWMTPTKNQAPLLTPPPDGELSAFIAFQQRQNLNLEFP